MGIRKIARKASNWLPLVTLLLASISNFRTGAPTMEDLLPPPR